MKDFKNLGFGLVLAGTTLVLGSALTFTSNIPSTQAAEITITGKANISKFIGTEFNNEVISFNKPFITESSSGLFEGLVANSIASIYLTSPRPQFTIDSGNGFYIANVVNVPFISFTDGSRFEIDNPFNVIKYSVNNNWEIVSVFEGKYVNYSGEFFRRGIFTINQIKNISGEGNFSLNMTNICCSPTPIPEPTSTGAVTVLGLGTLAFAQKVIRFRKI
ncbi:hypothetical protein NIES2111_02170 [Nostoc sp. NIES-2111]|nr:hypothetical protein NIES2111_02170 [Nostoc sp. NIES-2111]